MLLDGLLQNRVVGRHHGASSQGHEVEVEGLGDEGERPGHSEVALDDFQLVVFGDQLHVERTVDLEGLGNFTGDLFDLFQSDLNEEVFKRKEINERHSYPEEV